MRWVMATLWFWVTVTTAAMAFSAVQEVKLPEGEGKELVEERCTVCHGLERIVETHTTRAGWDGIVKQMLAEGVALENEEIPRVVDYLAKNFGPGN